MQNPANLYHQAAKLLNDAGAPYVIVGGFSLIMHGSNRFTPDVNVAVSFEGDDPLKFVNAIIAGGLEPPIGVDPQQYINPETREIWFNQKACGS